MLVTVTKDGYLPYVGSTRVGSDLSGIVPVAKASPRVVISPNPVKGQTTITFSLPPSATTAAASKATLRIIDVTGKVARDIKLDESALRRGTLSWDGTTTTGEQASPGIYFVELSTGATAVTTKLVILK